MKEFLREGLLVDVSQLASKATRLTQKWLASDLEVRANILFIIILLIVCVGSGYKRVSTSD